MKKTIIFQVIGIFVFTAAGFLWAMPPCDMKMNSAKGESAPEAKNTDKKAVAAGNKICPVSGEAIDEKLKATYEYEGKTYNFCCAMCIDDFKKDPQKYIKKVEEQKQKEEVNKKDK